MRGLLMRAVVVASAIVIVSGAAAGVASASGTPMLSWSPTTSTTPSPTFDYNQNPPVVTVGSSKSQTFTLKNTGGVATSMLTITLVGSAFSIPSGGNGCAGTSLGPSKTCHVTIVYKPASAGQADTGTLTATSKKPNATATLNLKGTGTKASPSISTSQKPATAAVGAPVADQATVSGGFNPGGSVTFNLYNNPNCTGPALFTDTDALTGGAATSHGYITTAAGTDYWAATYNGDANNASVTSACNAEPVQITGVATPAISTNQQPSITPLNRPVQDQATVSGGNSPTGSVAFNLYNNPNCTGRPLFTDTEALNGGSANSAPYVVTVGGTDYWVATYNGDTNNASVTSACNAEPVTITGAAGSPGIRTTAQQLDAPVGAPVQDQATVSGGVNLTGSVTFTLFDNPTCTGLPLFTDTQNLIFNPIGGSATSAPYVTTDVGTDYWVATYNGDASNASVTSGCADEPVTITP